MIRIKKIGIDGLEHEYWEMTEEEKAEAKAKAEERKSVQEKMSKTLN